jgi:galactose mutarotase-like enzyme
MEHRIGNDILSVRIAEQGAELQSVRLKKSDTEYLWQGDAAWWPRRAPVLFPVVGKLNNNRYSVEGKEYSLPQHGFARDQVFEVKEHTDRSITFSLSSGEATRNIYPFDFQLLIRYTLENARLITSYEVLNKGDRKMLFSIGAHPGFCCPLEKGASFSDHYLEFEHPETLSRHLLQNGCFSGETEPVMENTRILRLDEKLFEKDAIVFKNMRSSSLLLKNAKGDSILRFNYRDFPYFGIWTKPGAPFICLEPWCGIADQCEREGELAGKEGIIPLEAGGHFSRSFSAEIFG